ncbi:MAG: hypothetical protein J3R72DRAFT_55808 [Linnemannia gamsii]|nr:MAG: hypothetical protein J3R72DRAFT_55808 [Linnemannia gamsii]
MGHAVNITDLVPRQLPQQPNPPPPGAPPGRQGVPPGGGGGGLKPAAVPSTFTTFAIPTSPSTTSVSMVASPITPAMPTTPDITTPVIPTPTWGTAGFNNTSSGFIVTTSILTTGASQPSPTSPQNNNNGSVNMGAVVAGVCATLAVIAAAIGFWVYHRRKRNRTRAEYEAPSRPWYYDEKGLHQQLGSRLSSPTLSHYGDQNDYYHPSNTNTNNNCTGRGPQIFYPEAPATTGEMRSVPHTLPDDTAVYWPPPPPGHAPPPPLPPPPFKSLSPSPTTSLPILYRDPGRNPQDHQKQEQLERALMQQQRQIQELRELQQRHIQENPLSCISAPHAPTLEDRKIWQQNDQEQRQLWLRQTGGNSGPVVAAAAAAAAAIAGAGAGDVGGVSGSICAVRDPQYWGPSDNLSGGEVEGEKKREREEGSGESFTTTGTIKQQHQQEHDLRQYIAQMKEQYEEQFRRHQEELSRIRAEQESQLQMLRDQIKE